jgi:hypothetical protein
MTQIHAWRPRLTFAVVLALALAFALVLTAPPAFAAQELLAEVVNADVHDHDVSVRVRTSLREPVAATDAKPTMPPLFAREELAGVVERYGPYLVDHVHLVTRNKPLVGKLTSAKLVDEIPAPVQVSDLERFHAEYVIVYPIETQDPITISFDVLGDRELVPGVPWPIAYSFDVHGPRSRHADLANHATYTFDVVEGSSAGGQGPRADGTTGRRRGNIGGSALVGGIIFASILYIAYSIIQKRRRR